MSLSCKITQLSSVCARVQICPEDAKPSDSALNRYGFIFEDAVQDNQPSRLDLKWSPEKSSLNACDSNGNELFRIINTGFRRDGALVECELFDETEDWIGFGDQTRERLYHRGHKVICEVSNVASYIPVPFFMSNRGYAIMVNTTYSTIFDMGCTDKKRFCWFDKSKRIDFYIWKGANFKELLDIYTRLTGRPELPPRWSFGLWHICRTQANDEEVLSNARLFREYDIPCDVIGLEPGWMETNYDYSTGKDWNRTLFPLPSWQKNCHHTFIKALKRMGYKLELWLCNDYDLSFEEERRIGAEKNVEENDAPIFCKDAEIDDHFSQPIYSDKLTNPEEPWFKHLEKFVDWGADFFKQDGALQVCKHPDRYWRGSNMLDDEMHNLYPLLYSRQMNEGFAKYTNRRALVFNVCGWIGFQHYCGTWTGDTGGRIETLGAMLNTSCVGHSWSTNDMEAAQAEGIHFGYLLPWSQINSWTYFRMPWLQGNEYLAMHQYYSQLRASLMPYLYSAAYSSSQNGMPMLMPLTIEYQNDAECRNILHEYLLGSSLLVTIYKHEIYLPEGEWRDFWTGKTYTGNQHISDFQWQNGRGGGLFLRSGAIVPMTEVMSYTDEKTMDKIELVVYPGNANSSVYELYEDDGVTFEYRNGDFALSRIEMNRTGDTLTLSIAQAEKSKIKDWSVMFCIDSEPAKILNNNKQVAGVFSSSRNELVIENIEPGILELKF